MDERKAPRAQDPNDVFAFYDNQIPQLRDGSYTLSVTSTLNVNGAAEITGTRTLQFRVAGPQLTLPPGEIVAQFPANKARGAYHTVLPHVTLARASLPWERTAGSSKQDPWFPWLLLLIIPEDDLRHHVKRHVWNVGKESAAFAQAGIPHDHADPQANIPVATLSAQLVSDLLPKPKDLDWLAHVRDVIPPGAALDAPVTETATVISPILPTAGSQNHALLVSMENRYTNTHKPAGDLTVPVLYEWSFYCQPAHEHTLTELLKRAMQHTGGPAPLVVPPDPGTPVALAARLEAGFIPVEHHMRRGDLSAAWLRSPLAPRAPIPPTPEQKAHLPARHSDGFLSLDEDFGLLDVSFAAAWELGRLLILEQPDISQALYRWKREQAQTLHVNTTRQAGLPLPDMPEEVSGWITSELLELRSVPFAHLVPDPAMLPAGAFRFFDIDPFWLDCLRDGALSVGRTHGAQHKREIAMRATLNDPAEMSGFLLRNAAVTDFPHLEVDGYDSVLKGETRATISPLNILRFERLSRDVLLVIFAGKVVTADLHLHPRAVHFGFVENTTTNPPQYEKHVKNVKGVPPVPVTRAGQTRQRIEIHELAKSMVKNIPGTSGDVSKFALQMIEGVELVRFRRDV